MKTSPNSYKPICLRVTEEEFNYITQQSGDMNISTNSYIKKKLLNDAEGCKIQLDQIMQLIPRLYYLISKVEDSSLRHELNAVGGQICQCLK